MTKKILRFLVFAVAAAAVVAVVAESEKKTEDHQHRNKRYLFTTLLCPYLTREHKAKMSAALRKVQDVFASIFELNPKKLTATLHGDTASDQPGSSGVTSTGQAQSSSGHVHEEFRRSGQQSSVFSSQGAAGEPPTTPPPGSNQRPVPQDAIFFPPDSAQDEDDSDDSGILFMDGSHENAVELDVHPDLAEHRYAQYIALARERFGVSGPLTGIHATRVSLEDSLVRPGALEESLSTVGLISPTQIQGLTWFTPKYINCCNFDFFLTYIGLRSSQKQPNFGDRYFRSNSDAENSLREILQYFEDAQMTNLARSEVIKKTWVKVARIPQRERVSGVFNALANSEDTINFPLRESCGIVPIRICFCKNPSTGRLRASATRMMGLSVSNLDELKEISRNSGNLQDFDALVLSQQQRARCNHCNKRRLIPIYFISSATWFISVHVGNDYSWSSSSLPLQITVNEVENPNTAVRFDLGIVEFTSGGDGFDTISHATAFFVFGAHWYYYDDMKSGGSLFSVPGDEVDRYISNKKLRWYKLFYFRR